MIQNEKQKATVLVCDDEQFIRDSLAIYLEKHGYKTLTAENGIDCLEKIDKGHPDAILLDIVMPKMDGISVIRKLREQGSNIPILVLSARHELGPSVEVDELSLGQFIPKPVKLSDIEFMIEAAIMEARDASLDEGY